jgi:hypothetical protein
MTTKDPTKTKNIHTQSGIAVDMVIKSSLVRRTLDNVTLVMVAFSNFEKLFTSECFQHTNEQIKESKPRTDEDDNKYNIYSENYGATNNHSKQTFTADLNSNSTTGTSGMSSYNNHLGSINNGVNSMNLNQMKVQSHSTKTNTSGISNMSLNSLHSPNSSHHQNEFSSNSSSFPRKNSMQKKLVSLDLTSSKAAGINFQVKDLEKKRLEHSEQYEKKFHHFSNNRTPLFLQSNLGDNHPVITKNSINKRESSLKKNPK